MGKDAVYKIRKFTVDMLSAYRNTYFIWNHLANILISADETVAVATEWDKEITKEEAALRNDL